MPDVTAYYQNNDVINALRDAEWISNNYGEDYALIDADGGIEVLPLRKTSRDDFVLEVVKPTKSFMELLLS